MSNGILTLNTVPAEFEIKSPAQPQALLSQRIQDAASRNSDNGHVDERNMVPMPVPVVLETTPLTLQEVQSLEYADAQVSVPLPFVEDFNAGRIRATHHGIARDLAQNKSHLSISRTYGVHPNTVEVLLAAPAFQSLVEEYKKELAAGNEVEFSLPNKMRAAAHDSIDLLRERMATEPQSISTRELLSISETTLDRTGYGKVTTQVVQNTGLQSDELSRIKSRPPEQGELTDVKSSTQVGSEDKGT